MALERYKKWIVIGILAGMAAIVLIAVNQSKYKSDKAISETREQPLAPPGPFMDSNLNKVVPIEELGVDAGDPQKLAALGDQYFEKRQYYQAIELYKRTLDLNPDDFDTCNDLGLAYHYTNSPELAVEALRKGTEIMPGFQRGWLSLGFVLASTGKNNEAKEALKKALEIDSQNDVGQEAARIMGLL